MLIFGEIEMTISTHLGASARIASALVLGAMMTVSTIAGAQAAGTATGGFQHFMDCLGMLGNGPAHHDACGPSLVPPGGQLAPTHEDSPPGCSLDVTERDGAFGDIEVADLGRGFDPSLLDRPATIATMQLASRGCCKPILWQGGTGNDQVIQARATSPGPLLQLVNDDCCPTDWHGSPLTGGSIVASLDNEIGASPSHAQASPPSVLVGCP